MTAVTESKRLVSVVALRHHCDRCGQLVDELGRRRHRSCPTEDGVR